MNDEVYYEQLIERFIKTGEIPVEFAVQNGKDPDDAITRYLFSVMRDPVIMLNVMGDPVGAIILKDDLMRFVDLVLERGRFRMKCTASEESEVGQAILWSLQKKQDGWSALLMRMDRDYSKYGFRSQPFREQFSKSVEDPDIWKSLYEEYKVARGEKLRDEMRQDVANNSDSTRGRLSLHMKEIPEALERTGSTPEDFRQAWSMMGGEWNEHQYAKLLKLVRLQEKHPALLQIAALMGRTADPEGTQSVWAGSGKDTEMNHSQKSDIEGVGFGGDLGSAMPMELALMAGDDTSDLFSLRYATRTLQVFRHRSETLGATRRLFRQKARLCGPMIVCIDTSGSMAGKAYDIARSMLMKLVTIAEDSHRNLFVVAFSVAAVPIDARRERLKLQEFFRSDANGGTRAEDMLKAVMSLLDGRLGAANYMAADVMWLSDFYVPLPNEQMLRLLQTHRKSGTRFYGLQVGDNPSNEWRSYFDTILQVYHDIIPPRGK